MPAPDFQELLTQPDYDFLRENERLGRRVRRARGAS